MPDIQIRDRKNEVSELMMPMMIMHMVMRWKLINELIQRALDEETEKGLFPSQFLNSYLYVGRYISM